MGVIDPIFQSANYQLAQKLLDATALRQEAIASNVANADTPGYRRLDINADFATELRAKMEAGKFSSAAEMKPVLAQDLTARAVRPDGNNVEIEHELLEMNRNTVDYNYLTEIITRNIKQMKMAISGRVM